MVPRAPPVATNWRTWLAGWRPPPYRRKNPLVLLNGLAEQPESWFRNHRAWRRTFDVFTPNILAYDGDALHARVASGLPVSVEYLVEELHAYLTRYVQCPPYHLVASSLGGKVAVEFAVRYPDLLDRVVLLCPSGMGDAERLPVVEGVRRSDAAALVRSVFHSPRFADPGLIDYYNARLRDRRWKTALLKTVRGTNDHVVFDKLELVPHPTLVIGGAEDRIVDPQRGVEAARRLPRGEHVMVPRCGHAPQIEAAGLVNRLVERFLLDPRPVEAEPGDERRTAGVSRLVLGPARGR
jgi:pimeloyl-ACP methyl ester carboxylesterase